MIRSLSHNSCTLDKSDGTSVTFDTKDYQGLRLGYASTIHKSQGKTVDETMVLHSPSMDQRLSYVSLSRQTHSLTLYVSQDQTRSLGHLAYQMDRGDGVLMARDVLKERDLHQPEQVIPDKTTLWDSVKQGLKQSLGSWVQAKVKDRFHHNKDFYQNVRDTKNTMDQATEALLLKTLQQAPSPLEKVDVKLQGLALKELDQLVDIFHHQYNRAPNTIEARALEERTAFEVTNRPINKNPFHSWLTRHGYAQIHGKEPMDHGLLASYGDRLTAIEGRMVYEVALTQQPLDRNTVINNARQELLQHAAQEAASPSRLLTLQNIHKEMFGTDLLPSTSEALVKVLETIPAPMGTLSAFQQHLENKTLLDHVIKNESFKNLDPEKLLLRDHKETLQSLAQTIKQREQDAMALQETISKNRDSGYGMDL